MQNRYDIENQGKHLKAHRVLEYDVTNLLATALSQGELTLTDVLDIQNLQPDEDHSSTGSSIVSQLDVKLLTGGINQ